MAGIKELQAKVKEDAALAAKIKAVKTIDEFIDVAKAAGFVVTVADIEKLTDISAADLAKSAGGVFIAHPHFHVIASTSTAIVV